MKTLRALCVAAGLLVATTAVLPARDLSPCAGVPVDSLPRSDSLVPAVAEPDSVRPYVAFPAPLDAGEARWSVGLSVATLPRLLVEEEVNQSPMIDARLLLGLPWNFAAAAHLSSNIYVANHISAGLRLGQNIGPIAVGAGLDAAVWFGAFHLSGFDNSVGGSMAYPSLSLGWHTGEVLITVQAELQYVFTFRQLAGETEVSYNHDRITGTALAVYMEQPLWKNHHVLLGAKISNADFFYQGWMAFSTFKRRQLYPELFFNFLLR